MTELITVLCPHCAGMILIDALNCRIFRHALMKNTNEQINPHLSKDLCEELVKTEMVYGCAKPFKIEMIDGKYTAEVCDYF